MCTMFGSLDQRYIIVHLRNIRMKNGSGWPARAAAKHVNLKGVRARCACSRHVACNMVGSAPVDDGGVGNPTTA